MAGLNISMPLVATIAQEIISLYALWDRYREDGGGHGDSARGSFAQHAGTKRSAAGTARSGSVVSGGTTSSSATPSAGEGREDNALGEHPQQVVTPTFLMHLLTRMREARFADVAHPPSGRPVAVNKRLERAQAAG